jgi:hypothetical protein
MNSEGKKGIVILQKGSEEAKAYMARLRSMRGKKPAKVPGAPLPKVPEAAVQTR